MALRKEMLLARELSGRGPGRSCDPSLHRGDLVPACKELSHWGAWEEEDIHTGAPGCEAGARPSWWGG